MEHELISVVIPAYNGEKTVEAAIRSVMDQSLRELEILVVDDCSGDRTGEIVCRMAEEDSRIRYFRNEQNRGVSFSRNRGGEEARGVWIAFLDCDDLWQPRKLEKQLALAKTAGADIIYTGYDYMDGEGQPRPGCFRVPETTDYENMLKVNVMSTSGVMLRRELLQRHPFRSDVAHEDLFEWLILLRSGARAAGIDEPLHTIRIGQSGSRSGNKWRSARNRMRLYRELGISRPAALRYWLCYAGAALKKYSSIGKN